MLRTLTAVLSLLLVSPFGEPAAQSSRPTTLAGRSAVYAPNGVIATSQPLATSAALLALQNGGNAIDAAVTAAAVLAVVEPNMTGMGGDLFAIVWSAKEKKLFGLNASGRAGTLMTLEELMRRGHRQMPLLGAETVTVPGAVAGWAALVERFGARPLNEALQPAIRYAETGFPVSPIIAAQWAGEEEKLRRNEGARTTFLLEGKRAPKAGEWFRNPDLANSLRLVAAQGPAAFYGGEIGRRIVDGLKNMGGFLELSDLQRNRPDWIDPISAPFKGFRVWEIPPNSQGVAVLEMLRILEGYDLKSMGHNSAAYLHHLIEAKKLAFADLLRFIGDPAHMTAPVKHLLDEEFIRQRRGRLDAGRAAERQEPGPAWTASETIYLCAADREGNMVSLINSIFEYFGSGVVAPGTGFALQNRGAGFTLAEGHPNTVAPGKRPFHTLVPAFVTRSTPTGEEPWLSFGVMGGSMQPQGHVQVLLNLLLFDMDLQAAIDAPRFRHLSGLQVALEAPIRDSVRQSLEKMGHRIIDEQRVAFGGAQAVMRLERGWMAGSDPRKDGMAAGY